MRKPSQRRLVERVTRLLARVEPPVLHPRKEAQRKVDFLFSMYHDPFEVERLISEWEASSEPKGDAVKQKVTTADQWVKQIQIARYGKFAADPDQAAAYRAARFERVKNKWDGVVQSTPELEAAAEELRRRYAARPKDPKSNRRVRDAKLALKEWMAGKRKPAKRLRYRILYLWQEMHQDGRPPTQVDLFNALAAENPNRDEHEMRRLFRELGLTFTPAKRGPKKSAE